MVRLDFLSRVLAGLREQQVPGDQSSCVSLVAFPGVPLPVIASCCGLFCLGKGLGDALQAEGSHTLLDKP